MLLDLWLDALKADIGICIVTDNRGVLRQHLYKARIEADNPDLDNLTMLMPEQDDEIWLVHKDADGLGTDHKGYPKLVR